MNSRARPGHAYIPTDCEHIANMVTHGLLVVPSLVGWIWMLQLSVTGSQWFTAFVYGGATFLLFTTSTTFHSISYSGRCSSRLKKFFHIGDRAVIYIFIAASYTPWLMLRDFNGWGGITLLVVWTGALIGIWYQYTFHEQYKWLETLFYVIVGVCPAIVCLAMREHAGLSELVFGGFVYMSGIPFFKCDGLIPFAHAIWHCFVFVGVTLHYLAVCKYLLGPNNESIVQVSL